MIIYRLIQTMTLIKLGQTHLLALLKELKLSSNKLLKLKSAKKLCLQDLLFNKINILSLMHQYNKKKNFKVNLLKIIKSQKAKIFSDSQMKELLY